MVKEKTMAPNNRRHAYIKQSGGAGLPIKFGLLTMLAVMVSIYGVMTAYATIEVTPVVQSERIEAGTVIEREIGGRQSHNFSFELDAGMYLRVVVDQKLGDVRVRLYNARGEKIHEADRAGVVSLSAIAEEGTRYRLEVVSLQRSGVIGRYVLKLENLHAAGTEDRQRLAAEMLVNEGLAIGKSRKPDDVKAAVTKLNEARRIWERLGDQGEQAATLYFLALRYEDLGDYDNARRADRRALELSRQSGDRIRESLVLGHLGNLALRLEDDREALDYYEQAAQVSRTAGNLSLEQIHLANSGVIAKRNREYGKAMSIYLQALKGAREMGDESYEVSILNNLARVHDLSGEQQKAIETYQEILPIWRKLGNLDGESATLKNLGAVYESMGQNERAMEQYRLALEKGSQLGNPNREAHIRADLARVYRTLGRIDQARAEIERALTIFESLRARLASPTHRARFASSSRKYTDLMLDLLLKGGDQKVSTIEQEKAFEYSERARARSLQEMLISAGVDFRQGADKELLKREAALKKEIEAMDSKRLQLLAGKGAGAAEIEKELRGLHTRYENLVSDMRQASPQLADLTQFQPVSLDQLQKSLLDDRSVLLEYYLGDDQSYLMAVTQSSFRTYLLPPREKIEKLAGNLYDAMSAPGVKKRFETPRERADRMSKAEKEFNLAAGELSRMLIGPVSDQIGDRTLILIPDGVLQYIPFAALPDPRTGSMIPLIVSNEIVNMPSAATLMTLRQSERRRSDSDRSIAVLADPVFSREDARFEQLSVSNVSQSGDESAITAMKNIITRGSSEGLKLPRLKYSRAEATTIAALSKSDSNLLALDFRANRDLFTGSDLSRYRYLHLATHGLMNSEVPALSGLVLSLVDENGQGRNGVLKMDDIYNLKLDAELVVLSACQTALGKEIRGEGLIGLTRGFMYAGARRVVSSLWMVDDAATAELMKHFYEGMMKKNLGPSASLRAAQITMLKKEGWNAPYFWAGFILQGEPR